MTINDGRNDDTSIMNFEQICVNTEAGEEIFASPPTASTDNDRHLVVTAF